MGLDYVIVVVAAVVGLFALRMGLEALLISAIPALNRTVSIDGPPESVGVARKTDQRWGDALRTAGFVRMGSSRQRWPLGGGMTSDVWVNRDLATFATAFWGWGRAGFNLCTYFEDGASVDTSLGNRLRSRRPQHWRQRFPDLNLGGLLQEHQSLCQTFQAESQGRHQVWNDFTFAGFLEAKRRFAAAGGMRHLAMVGIQLVVVSVVMLVEGLRVYHRIVKHHP